MILVYTTVHIISSCNDQAFRPLRWDGNGSEAIVATSVAAKSPTTNLEIITLKAYIYLRLGINILQLLSNRTRN